MSEIRNEKIKKRKREKESKQWTEAEIRKILAYMQMNSNVAKPTARLYYEKLIEATGIDATWNLLKCKIHHLKGTLQKANDFINSTDAGLQGDDGTATVQEKMLKICPHYYQLAEIFSPYAQIENSPVNAAHFDDLDEADYKPFDMIDYKDTSFLLSDEPTTSSAANTLPKKAKFSEQKTCADKFSEMEAERINFRNEQLKLEREKFEWSKKLDEKKLELERQKQRDEFELKKLELEKNEKIKMDDSPDPEIDDDESNVPPPDYDEQIVCGAIQIRRRGVVDIEDFEKKRSARSIKAECFRICYALMTKNRYYTNTCLGGTTDYNRWFKIFHCPKQIQNPVLIADGVVPDEFKPKPPTDLCPGWTAPVLPGL
ncbi:uncharacterized protein [Eurosta solidaginis]|uniref:uncharacterized protein n=1 Tax=Eurosta solidaginis TaxID=178769 RepID=UPI00353126B5